MESKYAIKDWRSWCYSYWFKYSYYFDNFFAIVLAILYLVTLIAVKPDEQYWLVFPTKDEALAFDYYEYVNFCNVLEYPVLLHYTQPPSGFSTSSLLSGILFFQSVRSLIVTQKAIYTWLDSDAYMDKENKTELVYYNIHELRENVMDELMIDDWVIVNIDLPVLKPFLLDLETVSVNKQFTEERKKEAIKELTEIIKAIEEKVNA